jgi:putative transposase
MVQPILTQEAFAFDDNGSILGAPSDELQQVLRQALHGLMEFDIAQRTGAERYERNATRLDQRNGTRPPRRFDTRMGSIDLEIPRLRFSNYMPSFVEAHSRSERAIMALVQEAVINGVSNRKVEKLARALGITSLSKSQVSEFTKELDEEARAFRERPLTGYRYPYVLFDAVYHKVRIHRTVQSQAVVIAYGIREDGVRELIGLDVVDTESYESWLTFMRGLRERGLSGVKLVITDAHGGLVKAAGEVFSGAAWQRCKVHFAHNVVDHAPPALKKKLSAAVHEIFKKEGKEDAQAAFLAVFEQYSKLCPKAMQILENGLEDALTFFAFPQEHWRKISSTNSIERINEEIRRRTRVIGIFPNIASALRLIGMLLLEQTEDWQTDKRFINAESMFSLYANEDSA